MVRYSPTAGKRRLGGERSSVRSRCAVHADVATSRARRRPPPLFRQGLPGNVLAGVRRERGALDVAEDKLETV